MVILLEKLLFLLDIVFVPIITLQYTYFLGLPLRWIIISYHLYETSIQNSDPCAHHCRYHNRAVNNITPRLSFSNLAGTIRGIPIWHATPYIVSEQNVLEKSGRNNIITTEDIISAQILWLHYMRRKTLCRLIIDYGSSWCSSSSNKTTMPWGRGGG